MNEIEEQDMTEEEISFAAWDNYRDYDENYEQ